MLANSTMSAIITVLITGKQCVVHYRHSKFLKRVHNLLIVTLSSCHHILDSLYKTTFGLNFCKKISVIH